MDATILRRRADAYDAGIELEVASPVELGRLMHFVEYFKNEQTRG
ncbi:hypothetical protein [Acetobacter nitrogenifigens]|nr:hypothetical protein [Acetobacter nitrogenifigens]